MTTATTQNMQNDATTILNDDDEYNYTKETSIHLNLHLLILSGELLQQLKTSTVPQLSCIGLCIMHA